MINTDKQYWREKTLHEMDAARGCRDALTNPSGHWRLSPQDPQVLKAVNVWVKRARRCHAIAMGREPIVRRFTMRDGDNTAFGDLYAGGVLVEASHA